MTHTPDIAAIAKGLSDCERDLLLGNVDAWGAWLWPTSGSLIAKGLFKEVQTFGGINRVPNDAGLAVRAHIIANQTEGRG